MKAILVREGKTGNTLTIGEAPTPQYGEDELLVRVKAVSLNRADILQRDGKYPPPSGASQLLGLDVAGIVEEAGSGSTKWKKGDAVFGLLPGGGYAQYAAIHKDMAMPVPGILSSEQAAAIPEVFLTAYQALFWLGEIAEGKSVLIHAGASGVGTAAIQLTKQIGAICFVTAGSDEKIEACKRLGADFGFNYRKTDFSEKIPELTKNRGVDIILDFVGASYWQRNMKILTDDGRLIILARLGGSRIANFDLGIIQQKRLHIIGSTLGNRSLEYKIRLTGDFAKYALPRFATGSIHPVVDRVYDWTDSQKAHQYMEENRNIGKIVLRTT